MSCWLKYEEKTANRMAERPLYVVDASVAGKWYLRDEEWAGTAMRVFTDYMEGRTQLVAPSHILYEVPSLISKAVGRGRLSVEEGYRSSRLFRDVPLDTFHFRALIDVGFDYSIRHRCSLYDATYLALADDLNCPYLYADPRLQRTLGNRFPRALWLEDYLPI